MSKRGPKILKVFWALLDRLTIFLFSNGVHLASLLRFLLAVSGRFSRLSYSAMLCLCAWNGKQRVPGTGPAPGRCRATSGGGAGSARGKRDQQKELTGVTPFTHAHCHLVGNYSLKAMTQVTDEINFNAK